jgi:RNA polymerase sigma-70 factor (ECF subfamily)
MNEEALALRRLEFEADAIRHLAYLDRLAASLTHHREDAEDLVQETLLRAYRFYDRFEPGTNLRAWLTRILKNGFINTRRQASRDRRLFDLVPVEPVEADLPAAEPRAESPSPEDETIRRALAGQVGDLLHTLPEPYRGTLLLHLEDRTYREISRHQGIPVGTVMSRLHRARNLLRERMRLTAADVNARAA